MEDRINIDGVWYVKENQITQSDLELIDGLDYTFTEGFVYENDLYCFEVNRIRRGDETSEFYPDVSIDITDKRSGNRNTWKKDHWDSRLWILGVLNENPDSLEYIRENLCTEGVRIARTIINKIHDMGWLKEKDNEK